MNGQYNQIDGEVFRQLLKDGDEILNILKSPERDDIIGTEEFNQRYE